MPHFTHRQTELKDDFLEVNRLVQKVHTSKTETNTALHGGYQFMLHQTRYKDDSFQNTMFFTSFLISTDVVVENSSL